VRHRAISSVVVLIVAAMVAGCGGSSKSSISTSTPTSGGPAVPSSRHVVMVMEENQSYSTVVDNTAGWPNLNRLMSQGALPTNYYADSHPSIGNYFMLTTGQILTTNDTSTAVWNVDNIARRMIAAGVSFKVYAEGIPRGYLGGDTGNYVIRHNPFAMLSDVAQSAQAARLYIWPFSQFATDAANNALPEFSFIVPSILDDAHTGTAAAADTWLQSDVVGPLGATTAFKTGGDGILIVDFDEAATSDTTDGGGHVSPVLWGPLVKSGFKQSSSTLYQHQSMLATIMASLGLSTPPAQAGSAPAMGEFFDQLAPTGAVH
jgi:acid phosphatase